MRNSTLLLMTGWIGGWIGVSHAHMTCNCYFSASSSIVRGAAPLVVNVRISGTTSSQLCGYVDWGDGAQVETACAYCFSWEGCDGDRIHAGLGADFFHTFVCPGTYMVTAYPDASCGCPAYTWEIVVDPVPLNLVAICDPSATECHLLSDTAIDLTHIVRSTVDWGDGTPLEEFSWVPQANWFEAPSHDFGRDGYFTVRVTNEFAGTGCTWAQTSSVMAHPGYTNPIMETTWGRIKALYAR